MYTDNSKRNGNSLASATATAGGTSALTLLGVAFVVLKLTGHISWPWIWVLSPFWGPVALGLGILVVGLLFWALYQVWRSIRKKGKKRPK